jgi:predicted PurR-regulated permease PerM
MARLPLTVDRMRQAAASQTPEATPQRAAEPFAQEHEHPVVDARGMALTVLAFAAAIVLTRYMREVLIPFVLAGLVFYALDPIVDWLQRLRVPRTLGAGLALILVMAAAGGIAYRFQEQALEVIEELPAAARKMRAGWTAADTAEPSALEKVQDAARELEKTAAAAASGAPAPPGVDRVQVEEPLFRASEYLRWGSHGMITLLGQTALVLLLTYFLLVNDELLKRKLVENIGPTLTRKKITVQILNDIGSQIERFLLVQIFASAVVAIATGLALSWFGLRHAWIWGLAAGIFNVIPYFGPLVVSAGLGIVGFVQFGTVAEALGIAGLAFVITTVEGYWLTPALTGRVAQINRVAIFAGLLFWTWLWGVPGMLLAVPMLMAAKAVCDRIEELQPIGRMLGD